MRRTGSSPGLWGPPPSLTTGRIISGRSLPPRSRGRRWSLLSPRSTITCTWITRALSTRSPQTYPRQTWTAEMPSLSEGWTWWETTSWFRTATGMSSVTCTGEKPAAIRDRPWWRTSRPSTMMYMWAWTK